FRPGRTISGFRTGALGMGHVLLIVTNLADSLAFYRDLLGFGVSDYMTQPFHAYFLHVNPRHHSLALVEGHAAELNHVMVELFSLDDVGQGYDIAMEDSATIAQTLGRHTNDWMTSFYVRSPGGFRFEYGWGGREVDPGNWQAVEITHGPSLWGHDAVAADPEMRTARKRLREAAARDGLRAPVQVMSGITPSCAACARGGMRRPDATDDADQPAQPRSFARMEARCLDDARVEGAMTVITAW